jgi:predicted transcriptional regulator
MSNTISLFRERNLCPQLCSIQSLIYNRNTPYTRTNQTTEMLLKNKLALYLTKAVQKVLSVFGNTF